MGGNAAPIVAGHSGPDGMNEVPPSKHGRFLLKANAEVSTLKRRRWRRRRRKWEERAAGVGMEKVFHLSASG